MTKVLVTGGSGFVGRNLVEQLKNGLDVVAPTHAELDLLDPRQILNYLQSRSFDVVIHAASVGASRSQTDSRGVLEKNRQMFLNISANNDRFGRLIFLGSGAEYDKSRPLARVKESEFGLRRPKDEYGQAKYFASEYIAGHQNIVNLRLFGVFGKYEDYATRFISNAICRALFGLTIVIRQNVAFDYLYVNDLIKIIEHFIINEPKEKFYNAGRGEGVELLALANFVKSATGRNAEIIVKNSGFGKEYTCDNSLLKNEMPKLEFTKFEIAIAEMVEWYRANWKNIDTSKLDFDA